MIHLVIHFSLVHRSSQQAIFYIKLLLNLFRRRVKLSNHVTKIIAKHTIRLYAGCFAQFYLFIFARFRFLGNCYYVFNCQVVVFIANQSDKKKDKNKTFWLSIFFLTYFDFLNLKLYFKRFTYLISESLKYLVRRKNIKVI